MKPVFDQNAFKKLANTQDDLWLFEEAKEAYDPAFTDMFTYDHLIGINDTICFSGKHLSCAANALCAIKNDKVLLGLAWYYYYVLYIHAEFDVHTSNPAVSIPRLKTGISVIDNCFGLCVDLLAVEKARMRYRQLGIPERYLRDALQDFNNWIAYFEQRYGTFGFDRENWVMNHLKLNLFRIGRLQFEMRKFEKSAIVFKNKNSGEVIAIANNGIKIREDGLIDGTNRINAPVFTTLVKVNKDGYEGYRIDPKGYIFGDKVFLSYENWEIALKPGDNVLSVHIPKNGSFAPCEIEASIKAAPEFFDNYLPWYKPKALRSNTWLFEDQLAGLLGDNSNIVSFQKRFYRYPARSQDEAYKQFVFFDPDADFFNVVPKTTLQRKIIEFYKDGGKLHVSSGFLLI